VDVWGTHDNIRILESFSHHSSPSDFLCLSSIDAARQPKPTRKRHHLPMTSRSGEGTDNDDDNDKNNLIHNDTNNNEYNSISSFLISDTESTCAFEDSDIDEWVHSQHSCPLFNIDSSPIHPSLSVVSASFLLAPLSQLDSQEHHANNNNNKRLTEEEKLLMAQEKRGKKIPSIQEQKSLLKAAHSAGHFGEKFMYTYIEKKGFWWPRMREHISQAISKCRDCQRYNIIHTGFHPSHSITAARPADHFQVDLAKLPQSIDGFNYCMVLVDVFSGFIICFNPSRTKKLQRSLVRSGMCALALSLGRILWTDTANKG
jgi:hypothetical protein